MYSSVFCVYSKTPTGIRLEYIGIHSREMYSIHLDTWSCLYVFCNCILLWDTLGIHWNTLRIHVFKNSCEIHSKYVQNTLEYMKKAVYPVRFKVSILSRKALPTCETPSSRAWGGEQEVGWQHHSSPTGVAEGACSEEGQGQGKGKGAASGHG